jgi:hypothetical protein
MQRGEREERERRERGEREERERRERGERDSSPCSGTRTAFGHGVRYQS